jgi:subtilisin family serine protease
VNLPNGVRLAAVNLSVGNGVPQSTNCDTHVLKTPIDNLAALDIVTVIAAGNDSSTTGVSQPACISTAFAVAASTKADAISSFSNMGPQVAVIAPGGNQTGGPDDILTSNANTTGTTDLYARVWGTSMAAPHVAGALARSKARALRLRCSDEDPET